METTNLSLMISCKYALWGQIALPSLVENAQSYSSSHCNIWISASSASPFPKSFFRKKSLSKNVVLQKCWLASFKPGQPDWKTSELFFFLGHFLQQGLPSFPDLLSLWKWFYWCFHSFRMSHISLGHCSINTFPPDMWQCVLRAGEGTFGCLWVPRDTLSKGAHLQCDSTARVAVQHAGVTKMGGLVLLFCHLSVALHSWCWVSGSEHLESGLQPAMLHPTSLGFPVSAASHIYDTDINEAQEFEVRCGLLFPHIYPEERTCYSILKLMFMHHFTWSR